MGRIYASAESVLVLDPELQKLSSASVDDMQLNARVSCCAWMTRCWTLQEARLAKTYTIALEDDIYWPSMFAATESPVRQKVRSRSLTLDDEAIWVSRDLASYTDRTKSLAVDKENGIERFAQVWRELSERCTTKAEDLHAILGIMLDLSPYEILRLDNKERMKAIFRTQRHLPLALLYLFHPKPKVDGLGNGWIPLYPTGHLDLSYGKMEVSGPDSNGISISLYGTSCCAAIAEITGSHLNRFCIVNAKSPSTPKIWVDLLRDVESNPITGTENSTFCYLLHGDHVTLGRKISWLAGTCFKVAKKSKKPGGPMRVICCCPLVHTKAAPTSAQDEYYPEVKAILPASNKTFILDFG
jgi:hypothetical protein